MTKLALVLNATFQPLTVVPTKRAIVLMLKDKVDVIETNGAVFRSEGKEFDAPSVVRLRQFVKVPFRGVPLTRRGIFARDNWQCQYCGHEAENIDHVIPKAKGGRHLWENVVASCKPCNDKKGDKHLKDTNFTLRSKPGMPRRGSWITTRNTPPDWEPYL